LFNVKKKKIGGLKKSISRRLAEGFVFLEGKYSADISREQFLKKFGELKF